MATDLAQQFCALRDTYIEKQFGRLNDMQREAVFTTNGPLLILAGAGSGKTTVLVNRIANLIRFGSAHGSRWTPREVTEDDVKALRTAIMTGTDAPSWLDGMLRKDAVRSWNVMAITFTNKAAGELKERLRRMLGGEEGDEVFASTFHSACVRILRRWAEEIGYPRSFTIYDTDDAQRVMKTVYKELSIDDKFLPIKAAINQMSRWKDQLVSPEQALADHARDVKSTQTARIYAAYEKKLKEAGAFDFDDLIYQTVQLLAEHPDVREFYQNKYRYLLVDEYQDTSVAQFRLVSLLTGPERNICVVGDDDQSIYRFRAGDVHKQGDQFCCLQYLLMRNRFLFVNDKQMKTGTGFRRHRRVCYKDIFFVDIHLCSGHFRCLIRILEEIADDFPIIPAGRPWPLPLGQQLSLLAE